MNIVYKGKLYLHYEQGSGIGLSLMLSNKDSSRDLYSKIIFLKKGDIILIGEERYELARGFEILKLLNELEETNFHVYPKDIDAKTFKKKFLPHFNRESQATILRPVESIAFFGGTFDPFHRGHGDLLRLIDSFFDLVYVIPVNNWQKEKPLFEIDDRIASIKNYVKKEMSTHNVDVVDWGKKKEFASTVHTFNYIKKMTGIDPMIILGDDNLSTIESWKDYEILKELPILICPRTKNSDELEARKDIPLNRYKILNAKRGPDLNPSTLISSRNIKEFGMVELIPESVREILKTRKLEKE